MKQDTAILFIKGLCYVFIGFTAPMSTALGQWANEGHWPPGVNWVVILGVCIGSAAASLLAFLSSSFSTYNAARKNGNGNTEIITKP